MSPLPERLVDRWGRRPRTPPGGAALYWHVLLGRQPEVVAAARAAQDRLAGFPGLHLTPPARLHLTVLPAGGADVDSRARMLTAARAALAAAAPAHLAVSRVLYHPEAIALAVEPRSELVPVLRAVGGEAAAWTPHVTLAYSTADQPAAPVVEALGTRVPRTGFVVDRVDLVLQRGSELDWDWEVVGSAPLRG